MSTEQGDPTRIVYFISLLNHGLTYEAESIEDVVSATEELLRRVSPLVATITIEQRVLFPANALKGAT